MVLHAINKWTQDVYLLMRSLLLIFVKAPFSRVTFSSVSYDRLLHFVFYYHKKTKYRHGRRWFQAEARGCLKSWLLFRHPREFKIKSLYSNDLILNIASKSKETVQKLLRNPR